MYFTAGDRLMASTVTNNGRLEVSEPRVIMETGGASIIAAASDGRFLGHRRTIPHVSRLQVILNWDEEVHAKLSGSH